MAAMLWTGSSQLQTFTTCRWMFSGRAHHHAHDGAGGHADGRLAASYKERRRGQANGESSWTWLVLLVAWTGQAWSKPHRTGPDWRIASGDRLPSVVNGILNPLV